MATHDGRTEQLRLHSDSDIPSIRLKWFIRRRLFEQLVIARGERVLEMMFCLWNLKSSGELAIEDPQENNLKTSRLFILFKIRKM